MGSQYLKGLTALDVYTHTHTHKYTGTNSKSTHEHGYKETGSAVDDNVSAMMATKSRENALYSAASIAQPHTTGVCNKCELITN